MTPNKFSVYLKGLSKYRRMAFFFLKYIFVLEISMFFYYANWLSNDVTCMYIM